MSSTLLTTQQAAQYLGVSASFLERARWAGSDIPFCRIGTRTVRYRLEDLEAYLISNQRYSTSEK